MLESDGGAPGEDPRKSAEEIGRILMARPGYRERLAKTMAEAVSEGSKSWPTLGEVTARIVMREAAGELPPESAHDVLIKLKMDANMPPIEESE